MWERYDQKKLDAWFVEIAERASAVITVSEMVKKDLLRRVYIPEERIRVIYYGVSEEFRPISDAEALDAALSKYGLAGRRYLLYAGGAEQNKNLVALIDVFCNISKRTGMEDLYLVLAGRIDYLYRALIDKTRTLGMERKVIFAGYVNHDDLPFIYNGAEAFVLPSLVEGFGIPVLEAMACGVPVVTSKNIGAVEAVGDAAALFDPGDAKEMADSISAVLLDKNLRISLREKGLERVKKLSWSQSARQTLAVYEEAYNRRKRMGANSVLQKKEIL